MNHRHRKVLHGIFAHPVSANMSMKDIESVVGELGGEVDTKHHQGARVGFKLNGHSAVFHEAGHAVPKEERWLVTSEGAFSYLARDFGLQELFLWPINADSQGTPQQVRSVIDKIREKNIKVIFSESTISSAPAKQVARETNIHYGGILYVDSLSKISGPVPTFLDLLKVTSETIALGLVR